MVLCVFLAWLFFTKRGRALAPEQSFFLYLVIALIPNHLLWPMGLVMCFPLLLLLVDTSPTPNLTALTLLLPMFLTKPIINSGNFSLWLICAAYWVWRCGWLRIDDEKAGWKIPDPR